MLLKVQKVTRFKEKIRRPSRDADGQTQSHGNTSAQVTERDRGDYQHQEKRGGVEHVKRPVEEAGTRRP